MFTSTYYNHRTSSMLRYSFIKGGFPLGEMTGDLFSFQMNNFDTTIGNIKNTVITFKDVR